MGKRNGTKSAGLVGDVCLYGNRDRGFHYLARVGEKGRLLGAGDPTEAGVPFSSLTETVWHAIDAMRANGLPPKGGVRLYAPGGTQIVDVEVSRAIPAAGELSWRPATVSEHVPVEG